MEKDIVVILDGSSYRYGLLHDSWLWINEFGTAPPHALRDRLTRHFLDECALTHLETWGRDELAYFCSILQSMDSSPDDFHRLGLGFLVPDEENIRRQRYPTESPLHFIGYTAKEHGLSEKKRRQILNDAFLGELPNVGSAGYMTEWGVPGSAQRLRKICAYIHGTTIGRADIAWMKLTFGDVIDKSARKKRSKPPASSAVVKKGVAPVVPRPSSRLDHLLELTSEEFAKADRSKVRAMLHAAPRSAVFKLARRAVAPDLRTEASKVFAKRR